MPTIRLTLTIMATTLFAQGAWAACYVVYGADKEIVYRAQTPPVDMSRNLHETLPQVAPGGTLVFSLDNHGCDREIHRLPEPARQDAGTQPRTPAHAGLRQSGP